MSDPRDGFEIVFTFESPDIPDSFVGDWLVDGLWYSGLSATSTEQFSLTYDEIDANLPTAPGSNLLFKFTNGVWWLMDNWLGDQGGTANSQLWWSDDLESWNNVVIDQPDSPERVWTTDNDYPVTLMSLPSYDASSGSWWFVIATRRGYYTRILDPIRIATTDSLSSGEWTLHDSITALPDIVADVPYNTEPGDWWVDDGSIFGPSVWATGMNAGKCYVLYKVKWFNYETPPSSDLHSGTDFILATADSPAGDWTLTPLIRYESFEGGPTTDTVFGDEDLEFSTRDIYFAAGDGKWLLLDQYETRLFASNDALGETWEEIFLAGTNGGFPVFGDGAWVVYKGSDTESFVFAGDSPQTLQRVDFDVPNAFIEFKSAWVGYGFEWLDENYENYREFWLKPAEAGGEGWGVLL